MVASEYLDSGNAKAPLSAWIAVAAGTLGAFMATLDISIVNSALPTIQGEIGASSTEATWVATSYLVAEIVIIPMAGWLQRLFGLRSFLLIFAALFTLFSILCGVSTGLTAMIIGRAGQGFTGGAMIPTAQTIIAQRLPPSQQPIGLAAFGITAVLGPVLGPLIGGWLTENVSWHYAFFINIPIGFILGVLLVAGLPHDKPQFSLFREADWLGILGLTLGLGCLTVLLEEGQKEQWFSSDLIRWMAVSSIIGFIILIAGQLTAARPIVKLSLLFEQQFGSVAIMGVMLGVVLYGTAYAIPQFLAAIAGYNALQAGMVVLISGIPSLLMMVLIPTLLRNVDIRLAVGFGLIVMGCSAIFDSLLTVSSEGSDFTAAQLMRGVGQILCMLFLSQAVVRAVPLDDAGDASGLFNAMRNLGGSIAIAGIATMQDQRLWLHTRRLEELVAGNSPGVQDAILEAGRSGHQQSEVIGLLSLEIQRQALVMTFNDMFWVMGVGTLLTLPLVLLLRPLPKSSDAVVMH